MNMNTILKRILLIVCHIILAPVVLLEYLILFWFWFGDGLYMLVAVPVLFVVFVLVQEYFRSKFRENRIVDIALRYGMGLASPVFAVCFAYLLAWICGIQISVW